MGHEVQDEVRPFDHVLKEGLVLPEIRFMELEGIAFDPLEFLIGHIDPSRKNFVISIFGPG